MPILSLRIVKKPKDIHFCSWCDRYIQGEVIRLYGMEDVGDKPYNTYWHRDCLYSPRSKDMLKKADDRAAKIAKRKESA